MQNGDTALLKNLIAADVFEFLVELQSHQAMRLQYCISVVCVSIDADVDGDRPVLVKHVGEMYLGHLRNTDVVAVFPPDSIALLLVNADAIHLPQIVTRASEVLATGWLTFRGRELPVRWSAGGGSYPRTASTAKDLLRQATALMARAREEGGGRLYLPT